MRMKKVLLVSILVFLLTGCNYVATKSGYQKVEVAKEQVEKIKAEAATALSQKENEIKSQYATIVTNQGKQLQSAANSLYGATLIRPYFTEETRPLILVYNRIDEAKAAIGLSPTLEAMKIEQERLLVELDETKTSLEQLKRSHEEKVKENEVLVKETELSKEQLAVLEREKEKIRAEYDEKIKIEQGLVIKLQENLMDAGEENKRKQEYIEKNKRLAMSVLGILSIASLIIGVYLPLFKKQAFTISGITGAGAILITFLQPIHFTILFTLGILIGLGFLFKKVGIVSQSSANAFNAIQEFKEKEPEKYKALKPILEEYNKKYAGDEKVEDRAVTGYIKEVLKDYEKI